MLGRDNLYHEFGKLGISCWGSYAGYFRVGYQNLVRLPDALSYRQAAAGRTTFSTAWELIVNQGQVRPGETVLINGAGGAEPARPFPKGKALPDRSCATQA